MKVLVGSGYVGADMEDLARAAELSFLDAMTDDELARELPEFDAAIVLGWPSRIGADKIGLMKKLKFVQTELAGVNSVPFGSFRPEVKVSSNAGAYSRAVGEFAIALLFAASKRIVKYDARIKKGSFKRDSFVRLGREVALLRAKTLGVLGLGGIGKVAAELGEGVGMKVIAYSRHGPAEPGVELFAGRDGLNEVLGRSDAVVVALPLTKLTVGLIRKEELWTMKDDAILVNVARAEIVDETAVYERLSSTPSFTYATDVWYTVDGRESYAPRTRLLELENFIGTPHLSGPSASVGGEPRRLAKENLGRFLRGEPPHNVARREDYV
jgi:phosphoglycerate dehydrogenase-like enzyme